MQWNFKRWHHYFGHAYMKCHCVYVCAIVCYIFFLTRNKIHSLISSFPKKRRPSFEWLSIAIAIAVWQSKHKSHLLFCRYTYVWFNNVYSMFTWPCMRVTLARIQSYSIYYTIYYYTHTEIENKFLKPYKFHSVQNERSVRSSGRYVEWSGLFINNNHLMYSNENSYFTWVFWGKWKFISILQQSNRKCQWNYKFFWPKTLIDSFQI